LIEVTAVTNNLLTENVSEPLDGATAASVEINSGWSNLTIDRLAEGDQLLANSALQYFEKQGCPERSVHIDDGRAVLTYRERDPVRSWFHLPWLGHFGPTDWTIHVNPSVVADITARTGGGNVKLNLTGMTISHLAANTGGGNLDVRLPDHSANVVVAARTGGGNVSVEIGEAISGVNTVEASSGAGNVIVHVPDDIPARVHATSGLGKVVLGPRFSKVDQSTYQTPDYADAIDRVDISAKTGAGNVTITAP
jgi:hypothetical protein